VIGIVGLSHATAPIEIREQLAIPPDEIPVALQRLVARPEIGEAMLLSTCNRVEIVVRRR
jgi:glutamyl-tRNA reductase